MEVQRSADPKATENERGTTINGPNFPAAETVKISDFNFKIPVAQFFCLNHFACAPVFHFYLLNGVLVCADFWGSATVRGR